MNFQWIFTFFCSCFAGMAPPVAGFGCAMLFQTLWFLFSEIGVIISILLIERIFFLAMNSLLSNFYRFFFFWKVLEAFFLPEKTWDNCFESQLNWSTIKIYIINQGTKNTNVLILSPRFIHGENNPKLLLKFFTTVFYNSFLNLEVHQLHLHVQFACFRLTILYFIRQIKWQQNF